MDAASATLIALISVCTRLYLDSIIRDFRCTGCQHATYVTMVCSHISNAILLGSLFLYSLITAALVDIESSPCWLI